MDIKNKICRVTMESLDYPKMLKYISNPPKELYYIGDITLASCPSVAIVGSRKISAYGKWAAMETAKRMAENDVAVISGMAAGADSEAHRGCLEAGGKTVAVLGCGIDICFPAFNFALRNEIAEKGLLLSEYPQGYPGSRYTFPQRNRIISGISMGTVIIEAGINSGSLITAERAAEQGRTVFALPGNINSVYSIGTNKLIQDGAYPLALIDDIFQVLGIRTKEKCKAVEKLGADEYKIFKIIQNEGEVTVDGICLKSGMSVSQVSAIVTIMEIKGVVSSAFGKIFVIN